MVECLPSKQTVASSSLVPRSQKGFFVPPLKSGEPRYLSNSQVELLLECAWKHKLKYIDDHTEPMTDHLIVGSAAHKGVEIYRIAQMEGRLGDWSEAQRDQAVRAAVNDEFDKLCWDAEAGYVRDGKQVPAPGLVWSKGIARDHARLLANRLVEAYFYRAAESDIPGSPKVPLAQMEEPIGIEEEFYVPIPQTANWFAKGRFDMRTKTGLVDLKTAKQRYSQRDMNKKTQPSFYAFAWEQQTGVFLPEFRYHMLIKPTPSTWIPGDGPPPENLAAYRTAVQRTTRRIEEIRWFENFLRQQIFQIEMGAQVPRQNADFCDFCGVAKQCKPWLNTTVDHHFDAE